GFSSTGGACAPAASPPPSWASPFRPRPSAAAPLTFFATILPLELLSAARPPARNVACASARSLRVARVAGLALASQENPAGRSSNLDTSSCAARNHASDG